MYETPRQVGPTSGSFGAGSFHSVSRVGLGPVDGSPPGRLAEAPGRRWQPEDGGLLRHRATVVLEGVPPISGISSGHGGDSLPPRSRHGGGGGDRGGPGHGRRDGEIFNGWHWKRKRRERSC